MDRKRFIRTISTGGLGFPLLLNQKAGGEPVLISGGDSKQSDNVSDSSGIQRLHYDAQTNPKGVEYFFLGNGKITVALQYATGEGLRLGMTPLGLLIWDPAQFSRKWSTYLFHPEWGLKREMMTVTIGDNSYQIDPSSLSVRWDFSDKTPVVNVSWKAESSTVTERFWVPSDEPILIREVSVDNQPGNNDVITLSTALYYNHILFTEFSSNEDTGILTADGYGHIRMFSDPDGEARDRYLDAKAVRSVRGKSASATFYYVIQKNQTDLARINKDKYRGLSESYWDNMATVQTPVESYNRLFSASRNGLRAAVSESGRFDASIWEYNMEWTVDSSMVALGAIRSGQFELAKSVLNNIVTRLSNKKGIMAHASRFRDNMETELNQQGVILGALWTYWAWTGDLELIKKHWSQIKKIAEFPLSPKYLHECGLLHAEIEFFERGASMGILPGFAIAHQSFVGWGLAKAAILAQMVNDHSSAERWKKAGSKMREAMLHHPQFSLVDEGYIIKRRLLDGSRQSFLKPKQVGTDNLPKNAPLATGQKPLLDPDISSLFPILLGQINPEEPVAKATVREVMKLWNPIDGGYFRYNPASEPEEPGSWIFPTAFVAEALAETGDMNGVQQVLNWFTTIQGAKAGSYFEFYSRTPRPVPPLPPLGIIPWGWAEITSLFVKYIMGARANEYGDRFLIKPHLIPGCDNITGSLIYRGAKLRLMINHDQRKKRNGVYNGQKLKWTDEGFVLPENVENGTIEINI